VVRSRPAVRLPVERSRLADVGPGLAGQDLLIWLRDGVGWRYANLVTRIRPLIGIGKTQWSRLVMDRETERLVRSLDYRSLDAIEISGTKWRHFGFASYRSLTLPDYDVCERPVAREAADLVIAEQVLEHVLWPYRAVRHVWQTLRPSGIFLVTTPFLVKVHHDPVDCSRWTELGLKHLLAEGGFHLEEIVTGSWGNRSCVRGSFRRVPEWIPWWHSLQNEPQFPVMVWAMAEKR